MHTAKSHIKIVRPATTQNVVAGRAFARGFLQRQARHCSLTATFANGQIRTATRTINFDAPPVVAFTSPNDFQTFGAINPTSPRDLTGNVERPVTLTGTVSKPIAQITRVMINQQSATLTAAPGSNGTQTTFTFPNFFLREGTNLVTATATDSNGQIGTASLTLYVDQTAPILTIEGPVNTGLAGLAMPFGKSNNNPTATIPSALTSNARIDVRGIVNDAVEGGLKVPYPTVTVANITTGLTTPGKVSDRYFIVEDVLLDVGQNELTVTATDWVGNARSQKLIVSRVNVGSNRITLAGGNRQRGALNSELAKPLIVTAIDKAGLPLANLPLTFEVLRGTGSINPATTSSTTTTTGSGSTTVTTTIPNALTGALQPKTKPNGVNPARRLLITTDANGRAAVWFTLGKQSGEAGNMVQVSASDSNSGNATPSPSIPLPGGEGRVAISESVLFTATGDKGLPSRLAAEGNGSQYAETGGQPLDALTAIVYDADGNTLPNAVVAYVIETTTDAADNATFATARSIPNSTVSTNGRVFITTADNNGRVAARPTMGSTAGTVKIAAYAFAPSTPINTALIDNVQSDNVASAAIANFQIAVLQQSDGPTQYTGRVFDHTGKPLAGGKVSIGRTPLVVTTDSSGYFLFRQDVPPGKLDVFVDGRAVTGTTPLPTTNPGGQSSPTQYPSIHFEVLAVRGQVNQLAHPIYLPPLLMSEAKIVGGNEDVVLQIPGYAGYEMIVKANSVTFPDGSRIGPLVVSPMQIDRLPMFPPDGWGALFAPAATLQPSGTRFDPPVELRIPNSQGLKPGERSKIYQWDQDLAQFVAMGWMTASEDGAQLITEPGSGLTKAGWHVGGRPPAPPDCANDGAKLFISELSAAILIPNRNAIRRLTPTPFRADATTEGCSDAQYKWSIAGGASAVGQGQSIVAVLTEPGEGSATVTLTCLSTNACGNKKSVSKSDSVSFVVTPDDDLRLRLAKCRDVQCMYALQDEAASRIAELEKQLQLPRACAVDPVCRADVEAQISRARTDFNAAKLLIGVTKTGQWVADALAALNNATAIPGYTDAIRDIKAERWERIAELERSGVSPALLRALTIAAIAGEISIPATGLEAATLFTILRGLAAIGRGSVTVSAVDAELATMVPRAADGTIDIIALRNAPVFERLLKAETAAEQAVLRELWDSKQYLDRGIAFENYVARRDYSLFKYVGEGNSYPIDFQLGNLGVSFKTWNGANASTIDGYIYKIMDGLKLSPELSPGVNTFLLDIGVPPGTSAAQINEWLVKFTADAAKYANEFGGVPPWINIRPIP